jgi:hypothetical protein
MDNLIMAIFEIASFGAMVVLVVLGLGIIASMMGIFNFAQGEFVLLGAYVTYVVHSAGAPVWLGMIAAPFVVGALGFVLERLIVRRFYAAPIVAMLGTYALGLIIREIVRGLIGGLYLSVPEPVGGAVVFGSMHFSTWRLVIIVITAMVMVGSYLLLARTAFGLRIRASLENPALARASGISTNAIYGATFAFGAALADPGLCCRHGRRHRLFCWPGGRCRVDRHAERGAALDHLSGDRRCGGVRARHHLHQIPAAGPRCRKRGLVRCQVTPTISAAAVFSATSLLRRQPSPPVSAAG